MPAFDLHFLPPSVTVNGTSMLDDHIAFALMADRAAPWSSSVPLEVKHAYLLPYAAYHESRQNWRPLFFAKFFRLVANASTVEEAISRLVAPNTFTQWSEHTWASSPSNAGGAHAQYEIEWSSSTAPPVVSPLEFVAYGYGSCSAWATFLTYVMRAVGLPARQVGTPCWNSVYGGVDYRGLASANPNVSTCWHGGNSRGHGGTSLNNHNWVEVYVPARTWASSHAADVARAAARAERLPPRATLSPGHGLRDSSHAFDASDASPASSEARWAFVNVPPGSAVPDAGLCGESFDARLGCGYNASAPAGHECDGAPRPGHAMRDHEILAATWARADDPGHSMEGGAIIDVAQLHLSSGEAASPLVWAPALTSPLGEPLRQVGLRMVNRTDFYRCKPSGTS